MKRDSMPLSGGAGRVREEILRLVDAGVYREGTKLPATREIARELGVNRSTVVRVYRELVGAGLLTAHVGQGTFVAKGPAAERRERPASAQPISPGTAAPGLYPPGPSSPGLPSPGSGAQGSTAAPERPPDWAALFAADPPQLRDPLLREVERMKDVPGVISFMGGAPESSYFPAEEFRRAMNRTLRERGKILLQYGPVGGYLPFLERISEQLRERGIEAPTDSIVVANGSQQALDLVARAFLNPGDAIAVENPTYLGASNIFRWQRARILPVPMDEEGIRPDVLDALFAVERPKLLYTMPSYQNPTGRTQSPARREAVLRIARARHVAVVEDDFNPELHYGGPRPVPLKAHPGSGGVIYLGTFSKVIFPGLRLGWVVAESEVRERLLLAKQVTDLNTSLVAQAALAELLTGRFLESHLARLRDAYRVKRDALVAGLERHLPAGVTFTRPAGGLTLMVALPAEADAADLLPQAVSEGVLFSPGRLFHADGGGHPTFRLSFATVALPEIAEGARRLGRAVTKYLDGLAAGKGARGRSVLSLPV